MIGRLLCRIGLHRWKYADAVDEHESMLTVVTYSWCNRPSCTETTRIVNIENRWVG